MGEAGLHRAQPALDAAKREALQRESASLGMAASPMSAVRGEAPVARGRARAGGVQVPSGSQIALGETAEGGIRGVHPGASAGAEYMPMGGEAGSRVNWPKSQVGQGTSSAKLREQAQPVAPAATPASTERPATEELRAIQLQRNPPPTPQQRLHQGVTSISEQIEAEDAARAARGMGASGGIWHMQHPG
jgi:subtilisin family serine protease